MTAKMWTNGSDYVIAETAVDALGHAMREAMLSEEDLGAPSEWKPMDPEKVWTLYDEDTGTSEKIAIGALVARHIETGGPVPFYQWSDEW